MQRYAYRLLLILLRGLMYAKRALVWIWGRLSIMSGRGGEWYRNTIGFRLYKFKFGVTRSVGDIRLSSSGHVIDIIGRRGTLQVVLFVIMIVVMLPHSKLYTRATTTTLVGRGTLLYQFAGPGEEAFDIEEITSDFTTALDTPTPSWREGTIQSETRPIAGSEVIGEPREIAGITAGGSAFTKPTIITGSEGVSVVAPAGQRSEIIEYVVRPGDVIGAIAGKYGVSVATILWANNLSIRSYIRPGDTLKILPTSGVMHKVKKGETLSKIAKVYGANEAEIVRANRLQEGGRDIVIGEELIVPGGQKIEPVPVAPVRRYQALSSIAAPPPSVAAPAGSGFIWPTTIRRITQYFGLRHTGVDIAAPLGTALYAVKAGVVIKSACGWNGGYGCHVIIDHGDGINTLYAHDSQLFVAEGDVVEQGQTIALVGSTGRSTGPHVHFEVRVNRKFQNPLQYIR